jgi:hypothetical protein
VRKPCADSTPFDVAIPKRLITRYSASKVRRGRTFGELP